MDGNTMKLKNRVNPYRYFIRLEKLTFEEAYDIRCFLAKNEYSEDDFEYGEDKK